MPVIQKKDEALAVGGVIDNVVQGSAFEFMQRNSVISIGVVGSIQDVFVTIQVGSNILLEESAAAVRTQFPVIPDEMYYNDVASAGDRLVIRVRNGGAAAADIRTIVQITPLN